MSRLEEPQAASWMVGSTIRITLAVSSATRPYSSAVLSAICQGPSISLPRHQSLTPCGCVVAVLLAQVGERAPAGVVAVLDEAARRVRPAGAQVDRQHRLDPGGLAPVHELVGAEAVGLGREPGEVQPGGPLLDRADAVFPVVAGEEVAARIAHDGGPELAHQLQHVLPEAVLVGRRVAGLEDAAVDAAAHVLDEGAEDAAVEVRDHEVAIDEEVVNHGSSFLLRVPARPGARHHR